MTFPRINVSPTLLSGVFKIARYPPTFTCRSNGACLRVSLPVYLENSYKRKVSVQDVCVVRPVCLHVPLPCLSEKSLQMENILTTCIM